MNWEERRNKPQPEYWKDMLSKNREHDSFFWEAKKHKNCTDELTSEIEATLLWDRWTVDWKVLNRIGNKINVEKQRKWLYQMICFNHQCLTNILSTNWVINEEILSSWKKLWKEIKNIAGFIKPKSKNELKDNLDNDHFVETFREFSLSSLKSRRYLEAIEKTIKDKEVLTSKEEYLDKLLPYLFTDLDFLEQYFSLVKNNNKIEKAIYRRYAQDTLRETDEQVLYNLSKVEYTIRHLKPLAYREMFLKTAGRTDNNIYDYLEDIEMFQYKYEALFECRELRSLEKQLLLSELLPIVELINKSLKQGSILYLEEKIRDKDNRLIIDLEKTLSQLDQYTTELTTINKNIPSSDLQKKINFITDTTTQYIKIMQRLLEQSTLSEMKNY